MIALSIPFCLKVLSQLLFFGKGIVKTIRKVLFIDRFGETGYAFGEGNKVSRLIIT